MDNLKKIVLSRCLVNNANCVDNADAVINAYEHIFSEGSVEVLRNLTNLFNQNKSNPTNFIYRVHLRITDIATFTIRGKTRTRGSRPFNHSFIILQTQRQFALCDAYDGIHRFNCRETLNYDQIIEWSNTLIKLLLYRKINNSIFGLFGSNYSYDSQDFKKDISDLQKEGKYVQKWAFQETELTTAARMHIKLQVVSIN